MADTDTDTEPDATKRANQQYDWFTSQVGTPSRFGYPVGEPTFDSPPVPEERAPGVGERAPGPGEPRPTQPNLPAPAQFAAPSAASDEAQGPPAPLAGPPPWAHTETPGKLVRNATNGEYWLADKDGWQHVGAQTASTGEPGEAGGLAPAALAALTPGGAGLAGPATEKAPLETPEGGWDPTATAPQPVSKAVARGPAAPAKPGAADEATLALANMKREQEYQRMLVAARDAATEKQRKQQADAIATVKAASADYVAYLERTKQPVPPELKPMPKTPDVKIRPWLDPEGKDAIQMIAQTLGMLAVAAGGVVMKAPITAMQYFREAAEAWRRDEVDAANSKLKQFEMQVTAIRGDNELALKQYEIADKQYAHNVEAKKAMVLGQLDQLHLTEKLTELVSKPYDEALAASKEQFKNSQTILDELTKYQKVQATLAKGQSTKITSEIGARAIMADAGQKLQQLPPDTPPAERAALEREYNRAKEVVDETHKAKAQDAGLLREGALALKEIGESQKVLLSVENTAGMVNRLALFYTVLNDAGVLPSDNTEAQKWIAKFRSKIESYPPTVQAAWRGVEQFYAPVVIGMERSFLDDKGARAQVAFGNIKDNIMSFPAAMAVIESLAGLLEDSRTVHQKRVLEQSEFLKTAPQRAYQAPAAPAPASAEPADEEE